MCGSGCLGEESLAQTRCPNFGQQSSRMPRVAADCEVARTAATHLMPQGIELIELPTQYLNPRREFLGRALQSVEHVGVPHPRDHRTAAPAAAAPCSFELSPAGTSGTRPRWRGPPADGPPRKTTAAVREPVPPIRLGRGRRPHRPLELPGRRKKARRFPIRLPLRPAERDSSPIARRHSGPPGPQPHRWKRRPSRPRSGMRLIDLYPSAALDPRSLSQPFGGLPDDIVALFRQAEVRSAPLAGPSNHTRRDAGGPLGTSVESPLRHLA